MNLTAVLFFGFFLGMRHATDPDHVVAVSTIVTRERTLRAAVPIGILWGLGHTLTILLFGGAIILFGVVIPPRIGLGMELSVAVMLVVLGVLNVLGAFQNSLIAVRPLADTRTPSRPCSGALVAGRSLRPLFVGVVHGLAGSTAVTLLVLGTIRDARWALGYLLVFGLGTIAGMALITTALAVPIAASAYRFEKFHRALRMVTGLSSVLFGMVLAYRLGFVQGLFTDHPRWTPQ